MLNKLEFSLTPTVGWTIRNTELLCVVRSPVSAMIFLPCFGLYRPFGRLLCRVFANFFVKIFVDFYVDFYVEIFDAFFVDFYVEIFVDCFAEIFVQFFVES